MDNQITVAEALLQLLYKNGITNIYGVLGDAVFPLFDALGRQRDVNFYAVTNEVNAAFMASYQAKLTGKVGVCVATSGPGTANLINGLADAYFDKAPVLAITGQVESSKVGTGSKQDINQQQLLQAVTSKSQLITSGQSFLDIAAKALVQAENKRTVTHLAIPKDVFFHPVGRTGVPLLPDIKSTVGVPDDEIKSALEVLVAAEKPLIVAGDVTKQDADLLIGIADKLDAGLVLAQQAKGAVPTEQPRLLGGIGEAFVPEAVAETDCILLVGSASYEKKFLPTNVKIVQLIEDPAAADYKQTVKILVGNIARGLAMLNNQLSFMKHVDWGARINQGHNKLMALINEQEKNQVSPIQPAHLMAVLGKVLPSDAVVVCDVGGFIHWFDTYFENKGQEVLGSSHWRSMGGGLPGALSACIHFPGRHIVALVGDGGMLMSVNELATAVKYQLPVTVVVANDHSYNLEKVKMEKEGLKAFGYDIKVPDFSEAARAFGAMGRKVTQAEQFPGALRECLATQKPAVVDVHLDPVPLPLI
ncbi:thiamine pyrophosphate-binding protein [Metallumcola ferriviriculae]|uniref:Thiamine pyrophosphate-binding protein n=1 Tax=Metallumcola ferriviriculae TaxID=3039180 RepID=A0AAU0UJ69_9FIRM|nr:thiamine pyrophosphate-binding protein [Desulfitibacteraceae bacterium MK1]